MKRLILIIMIIFFIPLVSIGQDLTATEIIKKANEVINQDKVAAKAKMIITTTSGKTRDLYYDSWSMNYGEKNLIKYTAPRRVKDQAMLMLNNADDIWSYFPRTNRVRKLATHAKKQKIQGSDFSYEDMGSGNTFLTDFTHEFMGIETKDGHECYKIGLIKKNGIDSNYSKMILWVDRKDFVIWSIDYYDEKDDSLKVKTLTMSDMKMIDGIPTPMKMVMYNHLDNTSTVQELLEVHYGADLKEEMFSERGLKK